MEPHRLATLAISVALLTVPRAGVGQEPPLPDSARVDSLRAEVLRIQATLDSLLAELRGTQAADSESREEAIERLRGAAKEAARAPGAEEENPADEAFVGRQRSLQALNPEISVVADLLFSVAEGEPDQNNFSARAFEFVFQSTLDPYSRANVVLGHHRHASHALDPFAQDDEGEDDHAEGEDHGHGGVTEVEEGYVTWIALPGGFGLTLGKFRQRLGSYNRWHAHALPGQSYFLPYQVFFGEEGLAQTGVSVHWLAPFGGGVAYEGWLEIAQSYNDFFGESRRLSYLAHLNAFWQATPATYLELGVSGLTGTFEDEDAGTFRNRFLHVEGGFNWRPPDRATYRELNVRAAVMVDDRGAGSVTGPTPDGATALGAFCLAELRLGRQWWIGGRVDWVENPVDPSEDAWQFAPTVSWWQSEWVRIRAEYDLLDGLDGRRGLFLIQTTVAMGPHKHETY